MRLPLLQLMLTLAAALPVAAQDAASADVREGQRLFESQCVRCHGVGGTGGVGPALTRPTLRRAKDDAELVRVILGGIPGTAMIGFWNLSEQEGVQVAAYVRALGRRPPEVLPGDENRGRALVAGKGACLGCHVIHGQGSGWAPDLSEVGLRLGGARLREALVAPGALQPVSALPSVHGPYPAFLMVEATTTAGRVHAGSRITEDDFVLVLREVDGTVRSLEKTRLRKLVKTPGTSPMPSYDGVLTRAELDDVVAYLASLRGAP